MTIPLRFRRILVIVLALASALCVVLASVELGPALAEGPGAWVRPALLVAAAVVAFVAALRLRRGPRSRGAISGHLVLYEAHFQEADLSRSPAIVVRGARDAVERFIPLAEFPALFGGYALWSPSPEPTSELPGEALGVWGRRTCSRFRRILRERGATIELRREFGPPQRLSRIQKV